MSLLDELRQAEHVSAKRRGCPLCIYINTIEDQATKQALIDAAAGTIGTTKLAMILASHNTGVGNRSIRRHRDEEHTP
jgi:hypothetical protein